MRRFRRIKRAGNQPARRFNYHETLALFQGRRTGAHLQKFCDCIDVARGGLLRFLRQLEFAVADINGIVHIHLSPGHDHLFSPRSNHVFQKIPVHRFGEKVDQHMIRRSVGEGVILQCRLDLGGSTYKH